MRRTLVTLAAASAVAAATAAAPASAEQTSRDAAPDPDLRPPVCASYQVHARYLADRFGETPMFTGSVDDTIILRVFVNPSTGSWTALIVRTDGTSCVTSAGENGRHEVGL